MTVLHKKVEFDGGFKAALSHIFWIGGATDAGKSSVAEVIAKRYGFQVYHYDHHESDHVERLAPISVKHHETMTMNMDTATMDERWVLPTPIELVQKTLCSFQNRFLLALEDLLAMKSDLPIVAEGFGFTPELIVPLLSSVNQAIWFVPTEEFKWASMKRRNKPYFRDIVSDPERGTQNFFRRDMLLADHVKQQAEKHGFQLCITDGTRSIDDMADLAGQHFALSYI